MVIIAMDGLYVTLGMTGKLQMMVGDSLEAFPIGGIYMNTLIKNAANLLKVKTIVTFTVVGVYAALALRGDITSDNVVMTTAMVIAFYFGTQAEKNKEEVHRG